MVQDLEQLLASPLRAALGTQVIQDEQRRAFDRLEQLVVGDFAARRVGGAQVVQQIGHNGKEHFGAELDLAIGDGGSQMRLAAAWGTAQQQPARRVLGPLATLVESGRQAALILRTELAATCGKEVVKTSVGERADLTPPAQPLAYLLASTLARNRPPKLGIADWHILADETHVLADGACWFGLRLGFGGCARAAIRPDARQSIAERPHQARYTSRSRNLVVRSRNNSCT